MKRMFSSLLQVLSFAAWLLLALPNVSWAVVPVSAGAISLSRVSVNVNTGEQYDPHVDQDFASYSELVGFDQVIHYYQFSTGIDRTISRALPNGLFAQDFLPDVQGGRVVFNRYVPTGDTGTVLFDLVTGALVDINPQPGMIRYGVSVGGNTVAYADMSVVSPALQIGQIYVWDLITRSVQRLTNDSRYSDSSKVSPSGDVITWESCLSPYTSCNIQIAQRAAGSWTVDTVNSASSSMDPATDGNYVVWESNAGDSNGWDIYFMRVGSTVPVRIELPDDQYHARIAGGVIVFESQSPSTLHSDLYVYEIASNRLFQFTNTPTLDETLNGITRLPTGELRVVWQVNDDTSTTIPSNNIYGATFALPSLRLCTLQDITSTHVTTPCRQTITGATLPFGSGTVAINLASPAGASFAVPPTIAGGFPTGPGLIFPGGIISYTVELPAGVAGGDATVGFTFTPPLPPNTTKLFKVIVDRLTGNSTLQQVDSARWTRIDNATSTVITLTLTDGVYPLDLDGVANGIIIDPLAIGLEINLPPVANAGPDQNIYLGQTAQLDGSLSTDPNNDPLTYAWTLDSAPAGSTAALVGAATKTPSLTPDLAGAYHVSLVVNDGQVDSAASPVAINVSLNLPPVAIASGTPLTGNAPISVQFSSAGSYDPEHGALIFAWNFGDPSSPSGNTSSAPNPAHTYLGAGSYTAVLTVTDNMGKTDQASVAVVASAPNLPPTVLPTATPNNGTAFLDVQFAANATDVNPGDVLTYSWNFGDPASGADNASTLANPAHTYFSAGTYTATVSVSDGVNAPVSAALTISVGSDLTVRVTEAKVERGEKGRVEGRVSMKANFAYVGSALKATDLVRVKFDGITLLELPFGNFTQESVGRYAYETKTQDAEIDFNRKSIKVSRHKMLTTGIDNSNGIDVEITFGAATGTDHFVMTGGGGKQESDLSHKRDGE